MPIQSERWKPRTIDIGVVKQLKGEEYREYAAKQLRQRGGEIVITKDNAKMSAELNETAMRIFCAEIGSGRDFSANDIEHAYELAAIFMLQRAKWKVLDGEDTITIMCSGEKFGSIRPTVFGECSYNKKVSAMLAAQEGLAKSDEFAGPWDWKETERKEKKDKIIKKYDPGKDKKNNE